MQNKIGILLVMFVIQACSSAAVKNYQKDETLSTSADKSMPDWAEQGETEPFRVDGGKVYSVGITQIRGDERPEAGSRIALNNALANVSKHIENKMEFIFQNSEENASYDNTSAKFIGSEVSSITSHEVTHAGTWWKRFAQSQEDGSRKIFYKIYSLVTLPESKLKAAVTAALTKGTDQHKLSASFQKQVDAQWGRFVEGGSSETTAPKDAARLPASIPVESK